MNINGVKVDDTLSIIYNIVDDCPIHMIEDLKDNFEVRWGFFVTV